MWCSHRQKCVWSCPQTCKLQNCVKFSEFIQIPSLFFSQTSLEAVKHFTKIENNRGLGALWTYQMKFGCFSKSMIFPIFYEFTCFSMIVLTKQCLIIPPFSVLHISQKTQYLNTPIRFVAISHKGHVIFNFYDITDMIMSVCCMLT